MRPLLTLPKKRLIWTWPILFGLILNFSFLGYCTLGWTGLGLGLGFSLLLLHLSPKLSPEWALKRLRASPLDLEKYPLLFRDLSELAVKANIPVPSLFYYPSAAPNALTLDHKKGAFIALSRGLLQQLNDRELKGVLAHEVSHIFNKDIKTMKLAIVLQFVTSFLSGLSIFLMLFNLPFYFFSRHHIPWSLLVVIFLSPKIADWLSQKLSHQREYAADCGAITLTGDAEGLAQALEQIQFYLETRAIFGAWPLQKKGPLELETHPSLEKRLRLIWSCHSSSQKPERSPFVCHENPSEHSIHSEHRDRPNHLSP